MEHFKNQYPSYTWTAQSENSTKTVTDNINLFFKEHKFNIFKSISEEQHKVSCNCGESFIENHFYVAEFAWNDNIYCALCGHKKYNGTSL